MRHRAHLLGCFKRCFIGLVLLLGQNTFANDKPEPTISPSPSPSISPCPSPLMTPMASSTPSPSTEPCISPSPLPDEEGDVASIPCHAIHGNIFVSGPREGGLGPESETQAPWWLKFDSGRVSWSHGDVIEMGRYECRTTILYITIADQKQEVPFSDSSVIYQKVEYKKKAKKQP